MDRLTVIAIGLAIVGSALMAIAGTARSGDDVPLPGENRPGGDATSTRTPDRNAFSHSSANLPFARELDFKVGNGVFRKLWVSAPSSTRSSDGLGALYNARSCQRCHLKDGRGHPPAANWPDDNAVSLLIRLGIPDGPRGARPDPVYGSQLQDFAVAGVPVEGRPHVAWTETPVTLGDGTVVSLRSPSWTVVEPGYGPMDPGTRLSPRIAPPMIGLGLLEALPDADLLAYADPDDRDGDGISGRPGTALDPATGEPALGRFGWKASQKDLRHQAAAAFAGDLGLSTSLHADPHGDCTAGQTACRTAPTGSDDGKPEISDTLLDLVTFYSRHLAVPARRGVDRPAVLAGRRLFRDAGCDACHRPTLTTGAHPDEPALSHQTIWPYTDLLLHDMGPGLADELPEGGAEGGEWRTPPLWGIGLTETVSGHTFFLHDGRARSLLEAILWHGGEAEAARDRVAAMTAEQRSALLAFLASL